MDRKLRSTRKPQAKKVCPKPKPQEATTQDVDSTPAKRKQTTSTSDNELFEVEAIIESRTRVEFLVKWKGYGEEFNSWEPEENLMCPGILKKFQSWENSTKGRTSRSGR